MRQRLGRGERNDRESARALSKEEAAGAGGAAVDPCTQTDGTKRKGRDVNTDAVWKNWGCQDAKRKVCAWAFTRCYHPLPQDGLE